MAPYLGGLGAGGLGVGLGLTLGRGTGVNLGEGVVLVESLLLVLAGTGLFLLIFFCWLALCLELQPITNAAHIEKAITKVLVNNFIFMEI